MQNMVVRFVIGAILLVGGFGILAIQIMIVLQKQRDIAISRSVGCGGSTSCSSFFVQGVIISVVGGLLGDVLGKVSIHYLRMLPLKAEGLVKSDTFLVPREPRVLRLGDPVSRCSSGLSRRSSLAYRGSRVEPWRCCVDRSVDRGERPAAEALVTTRNLRRTLGEARRSRRSSTASALHRRGAVRRADRLER